MQGFAIVLLCAAAAFAALWYVFQRGQSSHRGQAVQAGLLADGYIFLFSGKTLWMATEAAEGLLASAKGGQSAWERLLALLPDGDRKTIDHLDALVKRGISFSRDILLPDGRVWEIEGQPRGALAAVYLRDRTEHRQALQHLEDEVETLRKRVKDRERLLNDLPVLAWRTNPADDIVWSNASFEKVTRVTDSAFELGGLPEAKIALKTAAATARMSTKPVRVKVEEHEDGQTRSAWLDVETDVDADGVATSFARNVSELVQAEDSLRRFVSTLTETFAHLRIGLAIFDDKRRLSLFNPALTDLVQADPTVLAQKPSLREFLDRLREKRIMPEQRDYEQWRANVARLEAAATAGTLSEHWFLSSGQTLHVTGRPHPNDAIAILIEDVSAATHLERQYSAEIELSRATLDLMQEAVAVFDTTGELVFANMAFAALWDIDIKREAPLSIARMTELCGTACEPTPVWGDLREFATGREQRAQWDAKFIHKDGREVHGLFAPMPGGSTLALFADISNEERTRHAYDKRLTDKIAAGRATFIAHDWALAHLRSAVSVALDGRADTVRSKLEDALAQTDAILSTGQNIAPSPEATLKSDLTALVADKGLTLDLHLPQDWDTGALPTHVYRVVLGLVTIARELAADGSALSIGVDDDPLQIAAGFQTAADPDERDGQLSACLPFRLLSRTLHDIGGDLSASFSDNGLSLTARLAEDLPVSRTGAA